MTIKSRLFLLLPLSLVLVFGCGPAGTTPARLSGKVTYKGAPLQVGNLTIFPKDGGAYSTSINKDGTYSQAGLPAGEMVVTIETESLNPKRPKPTYGPPGKPGGMSSSPPPADVAPAGPSDAGAWVAIPPKYGKKETSPLTVTLTAGSNKHDFELPD